MSKGTPLARAGMPAKLRQEDQAQRDGAQDQRDEEYRRANNIAKSEYPNDWRGEMELTQFLSGNYRR